VFTARYALSPYIKQKRFFCKGLILQSDPTRRFKNTFFGYWFRLITAILIPITQTINWITPYVLVSRSSLPFTTINTLYTLHILLYTLHTYIPHIYNIFTITKGQDLLTKHMASWSYSDTPHSVDSSGQAISPTQRPLHDNTQHSQQTDIHAVSGVQTHDPSKRAAADPRLRRRGHWDRSVSGIYILYDPALGTSD
jgi:hypothetical protein